MITEDQPEKTDAIVVLSGSVPCRILEAVDLYKQGYAPVILLTKEKQPSGYDELLKLGIKIPEQYEVNKSIALNLGVPATSIEVLDGRADSTYSEMELIYDYLKKRNFSSIIIVTSKSHATRATKIFNLVKGEQDIKVVTIPSKYDDFDPKRWWKVRRDWKEVIFEYQKLADYYFLTLTDTTILGKKQIEMS